MTSTYNVIALTNIAEASGGVLLDMPTDELPVASSVEEIKKRNPDVLVVEIASDLEEARRNTRPVTVKKNTTKPIAKK